MIDEYLRQASVPAWLFCLACLLPAILRILLRQARSLDAIWGVTFLLGLNRLSFLYRLSAEASHASALVLAIAMGAMSWSYQRHDR